jgi:hypothetical protein
VIRWHESPLHAYLDHGLPCGAVVRQLRRTFCWRLPIDLTSARTLVIVPRLPSWIATGAFLCPRHPRKKGIPMFRVVMAVFWICLLVGTLVAHSLVANWAVTLAGLYFGARWFAARRRTPPPATAGGSSPGTAGSVDASPAMSAAIQTTAQVQSRWTVDHVHTGDRRWR